MSKLRRTFGLVSVVLLLGAASACGDGGGDEANPAKDRAAAEEANLKAGDFPAGWNSRPHEKLPREDELGPEIARCLGISPPSERATAEVRSLDFTQGVATASSLVRFMASETEVRADAEAFSSDRFPACAQPGYAAQMHEVAPEGNTIQEITMTKVDFPTYGDRSVAHRIAAQLQIPVLPTPLPITIDLIHIFKGRAEAELTIVAPGMPFPPDFATRLAGAVAERL